MIVFAYPKDETKDFMKRVVAVGGDTVEIRDKRLIVNGRPIREGYATHLEQTIIPGSLSARDNFGPFTVPVNCFFAMGDNRDRSLDSRFFGVVNHSKIKGKVTTIYWSWDSENASVRWKRIEKETL